MQFFGKIMQFLLQIRAKAGIFIRYFNSIKLNKGEIVVKKI